MIIALNTTHPAAQQLEKLAAVVRAIRRKEDRGAPAVLAAAINISETNHGSSTTTYTVLPGRSTSEDAIASYQYVRKHYPFVLDLLCHAAARNATSITIEVGTMASQDKLSYSQHDLLKIMPRILALFRGTSRTS